MRPSEDLITRTATDIKNGISNFSISNISVIKGSAFVLYNSMKKIEELEKEEKTDLWNMTRELFPGKGKKELIELCKVVYVIGYYL